jgi:hypothetical protein
VFAPTTLPLVASGDQRLRRLFPDSRAALADYYKNTNILPITHTVCVGEALIERAPWVADSLLAAFGKAQLVCDEAYLEPKYRAASTKCSVSKKAGTRSARPSMCTG